MRFNSNLNVDFTKWSQVKMERENNKLEKHITEELPKYVLIVRINFDTNLYNPCLRYLLYVDMALAVNIEGKKKKKPGKKDWVMLHEIIIQMISHGYSNVEEKMAKSKIILLLFYSYTLLRYKLFTYESSRFRGIREGGVSENAAYYIFMHGNDGSIEAYPVSEWYNFQPVQRFKALSAEEAEQEFGK